MSRKYNGIARLSAGVGISRARRCELVYRFTRPLVQPVQPPAPRIIHNTVHQTVLHLHQTTHQHIRSQVTVRTDGHGRAALLVRQNAAIQANESVMDPSRPVWTARRLLRILSMESARRTMRPFYREMFRGFLEQEREAHRGKPAQSLLLVQSILNRRQTLDVLRRFYQRTSESLDRTFLYSLIFRRYVRTIKQAGTHTLIRTYAARELPVPDDLRHLPTVRRFSPPLEPQIQQPAVQNVDAKERTLSKQEDMFRINDAGFNILARRVADMLGRQQRLESLRRGGM